MRGAFAGGIGISIVSRCPPTPRLSPVVFEARSMDTLLALFFIEIVPLPATTVASTPWVALYVPGNSSSPVSYTHLTLPTILRV